MLIFARKLSTSIVCLKKHLKMHSLSFILVYMTVEYDHRELFSEAPEIWSFLNHGFLYDVIERCDRQNNQSNQEKLGFTMT